MGLSCLERIEIFPPIAIVISHCGRETLVVQCVSIVLLSAELGSCTRGPLCFMGPSWNTYFSISTTSSSRSSTSNSSTSGPLLGRIPYFMAVLAFSLGRGHNPKKDYKRFAAQIPFSLLHSVLMRFAQIVHDLFEVFTKKPQNPLDLAYMFDHQEKGKILEF